MSENQIEEKKGWSWLGFFFAPYYYAGYGELKKGLIYAILMVIPLVNIIVAIISGRNAKNDLPIGKQNFQWSNVGIAVVVNAIAIILLQLAIR